MVASAVPAISPVLSSTGPETGSTATGAHR
jgi:hypothetical protein